MMLDFQKFDCAEDVLKHTGEYVTQVRGESMYPMLRYRKDPVYLVSLKSELKPYDVAAYSTGEKYIVHRVLEVRDDCYIFRGDNCSGKEYVPKDAVIAVMAGFWRFGKFIRSDNSLYRLYSRLWVALNPIVRLKNRLKTR